MSQPGERWGTLCQARTVGNPVEVMQAAGGWHGTCWRCTGVETEPIDILLVEDEELDTILVERALNKNPGVRSVFTARDGAQALRLLRGGHIPRGRRMVVLVDLHMPVMDGLEFLRRLRADPELSWLPAIVLTTSADARDRVEAFGLNVAGYLLKPPTMERLRENMDAVCRYWAQSVFPESDA